MKQQTRPRTQLIARIDERFAAPFRNAGFARRTWFGVTLAAIVFVHLFVLALLLWHDHDQPTTLAKVEETAVEVVTEPAPPAPEAAAAKMPDEKPATSAPRAFNEETVERKDADKETRAPKAPAATAPPPPADAPAEKAEADAADPAKPDAVDKEAEALDKAPPEPPPEPPRKPAALAKPKPAPVKTAQAKPHPQKTAAEHLAGASDLPDYTFAAPMRKRSKITGGTEDDRYLAQVFGLIMQNRRPIPVPSGAEWFVTVAFQVDAGGNLVSIGLQHGSGYRPLDLAAIEAVQAAAPFPPPPSGTTTGLVARLHSPASPRAAQLGN